MIYLNGQPTAEFVPEIADNLTTDDSTKALSAKQGKVLNEKTASDITYSSGVSVKDKIDDISVNKRDKLFPSNTLIRAFGLCRYSNSNILLPCFIVPLENSDLYNIEFTDIEILGTSIHNTPVTSQFSFEKSKNGFFFYSQNNDVLYWFNQFNQDTTVYGFKFTISPIS